MSVRFVIGRSGTGKTRHCFDAIVERCRADPLGAAVFWILPKQATFTAERELACSGALEGYARVRVVSFEQLGREILAECGGVAIPEVTAIGRQMILGHLLRRHRDELKFFRSVAHQTGLAAELDRAFAELERCGNTAEDLDALAHQLDAERGHDESAAALAKKLHDINLLYRAYSAYLGQERLDPHRRLRRVLECVEQSRSLRGAAVYVDGFYDFSDNERRFLAGAARVAERVEITLPMDPTSPVLRDTSAPTDELSTFHAIEQSYRRLRSALEEAHVEIAPPLALDRPRRFAKGSAVSHLEACLFSRHPKPSATGEGPTLIEALDRRSEVDAAARHIRSLVHGGMRFRQITVLVRDLDEYHDAIDASFAEHGLPSFADKRRTAAHHPLMQFVRALTSLASPAWDHDAVMTLLKSGLVPLVDEDKRVPDGRIDVEILQAADQLENYVLEHRIRGVAWTDSKPWTYRRDLLRRNDEDPDDPQLARSRDEASEMDALRRALRDAILPFSQLLVSDQPIPLRQFVVAMLRVFHDCNIPRTLSRWIARAEERQRLEERAEHTQVWNELTELLDELVDLLGDEPVTASDFVDVLESGLESFDLALTPPTIDQVLVGSVDRTRTPSDVRATVVLGLHEGGFPRCASEGSIFRDSERRELASRQIEIDPDTRRKLFDERFYAYVAFTQPSEHLCLTRPQSDDAGRSVAPSSFWTEVLSIFPNVVPRRVPRDAQRRPDCIGTPRQLVTSLLRWARDDEHADVEPAWPALYQKLAKHAPSREREEPIDVMRYRAWKALCYRNESSLSSEVATELFKSPLKASVSRIETFATCPFKHFARYGLGLAERDDEDVTALDLGNVYHGILENVVRAIVAARHDFVTAPPEFTDRQIRAYAQRVGEQIREELMLSTARNQYLLQHAERTVGRVVHAQRAAAERGRFKPWKTELGFGLRGGEKDQLPPLELGTPAGHVVRLHGKIDRVDLLEGRERAAFAVIDYKLGQNKLALDRVYHGLSLQLLTYLLVLEASGEKLFGKPLTPAAAFYVQLLRRLERVEHPDDALAPDEPTFHLQVKPRGLFDVTYLNFIDKGLTAPPASSEVINASLLKDGGIRKNSDGLDHQSFKAMLKLVERRITELADAIIAGDVSVAPYRIGITTPCPACPYRSVCRFDPGRQNYRFLEVVNRERVLEEAMGS